MIVLAYFLVQHFGFVSGLGISSLAWMASMVILDDRLARREMGRFDAMGGGWSP